MENATKSATGWSYAREADPFSMRQSLALALGVGGIIAMLGAVLVTAATTPHEVTWRAGRPATPIAPISEVLR